MPRLFLEAEPQLDTREAESKLTVVEALVLSLERSGRFNPNDVVHPHAVLWTDQGCPVATDHRAASAAAPSAPVLR